MIQDQSSTSKLSSSFRPSCHLENSFSQLSTVLRGQTTRAVEKFNFSHNRTVWRNVTTCRTHGEQHQRKNPPAFIRFTFRVTHLQGFTQTHTMSQNTTGATRLLHLSHRLTTAVPHKLNTCTQHITTSSKHARCNNTTVSLFIIWMDGDQRVTMSLTLSKWAQINVYIFEVCFCDLLFSACSPGDCWF